MIPNNSVRILVIPQVAVPVDIGGLTLCTASA
jgi:hypothetical protein